MGTEQGKDTRIFVKTGDAVYTKIGGETTHTLKMSTPDLDTSDKDGPSGTYGPGVVNLTIGGNTKLPDEGLEALYAASNASPPEIEIKIMRGAVVRYDGVIAIGNFSNDNPLGVATWTCDAKNAAVPTVLNMVATS